MIFLYAGLGVMLLATIGVAAVAAVRAGQALNRETVPFRWPQLESPGRDVAVRLLRRSTYRATLGFWWAMTPVLGLLGAMTALLVLALGLSLGRLGVVSGLSVGGILLAGVSTVGAGAVIRRLLCRSEVGWDVPRRFFPLQPVATWFEFTSSDRMELGAFVLERRKQAQQEDLDTVAMEVAAVLGRVRDLTPEDLRAVVETQLTLWQSGTSWSVLSVEHDVQQTLHQIDRLLEHLEQELVEGVNEIEAREFWYTTVLRVVCRSAGPRALSGVLAARAEASARSGARRRMRTEDVLPREENSPSTGCGTEAVIDLRPVERNPASEPGSHRHEH